MQKVALIALVLLVYIDNSLQQGLQYDPTAVLRASNSYEVLKAIYSKSKSFRRAFQTGSASSACSRSAGSLCSPFGQTMEQKAVLLVASSPSVFDARSSGSMGSFSAVAQPKDQGQCNSCVAFALLAAAQSAMACALKQDASSSMSEHDFFFCKTVSPGEERTCASSWTMRQGIEALVSLQFASKYPVMEGCMPWNPSDPSCSLYECQDVQQGLKEGTFSYVKLESTWEMQEHIRNWGSFVTRLEVYSDFKPFFANKPSGIYPGHAAGSTYVTSHAIQVVGYDLDSSPPSWLCKNSWGTGFAAGGFFRIAFGVDGVGSPDDTYGIKFKAKNPRPKPYNRLSPAGQGGCYNYRALPTDFVSRVAYIFGISPAQILLDNQDRISQPDMLLTDLTVLLCGITVPQQQTTSKSQSSGQGQQTLASKTTQQSSTTNSKPQQEQQLQQQPRQQTQAQQQPQQQSQKQQVAVTNWQQQQQPQQPTPAVLPQPPPRPPATANIIYGSYIGPVRCEDSNGSGDMNAQVIITPGATQDVFELEVNSPLRSFFANCDHHGKATCYPSTRGLCGAGQEGWTCRYHTYVKWDQRCFIAVRDRPDDVEMCYSSGTFAMVEMNPPCAKFSGSVAYTG